jgi:hypothetical protein
MIMDVLKNAASFLQQGVAPPNTPPEQVEELASTNHLSSKKFFLAISGFVILGIFYVTSVAALFLMMDNVTIVSAYSVMFTKTMEVFATIMAVYLGGQALVDLRYSSSSSASLQGTTNESTTNNNTNYTANITEEVTVIHTNSKEDDYELE